jgi:hypothetical protein
MRYTVMIMDNVANSVNSNGVQQGPVAALMITPKYNNNTNGSSPMANTNNGQGGAAAGGGGPAVMALEQPDPMVTYYIFTCLTIKIK